MQNVNFIKDSTNECAPFNWGLTLFCYGCNLHCKMCDGYNYEKVTNKNNIINNTIDILKENITPLYDCVVFLGGEPTIYKDDLIKDLIYCRENNLKTKIFTNGMLPEVVKKINELKLCDSWSVDFKGFSDIKEQFGIDDLLYHKNISLTIHNIQNHKLPLEIRTTFFDGNIKDKDRIKHFCNTVINKYKSENPDVYTKYIEQSDVRKII